MTYEPYESSSSKVFPIIVVVAVLAGGLLVYFLKGCTPEPPLAQEPPAGEDGGAGEVGEPTPPTPPTPMPEAPGGEEDEVVEEGPEDVLETLGVGVAEVDPETLVARIGRALEEGNVPAAAKLIGNRALNAKQLARLGEMAAADPIRLKAGNPVSEIGELEINRRARWALNLDDEYDRRIYLDLQRDGKGRWGVEKLMLPPAPIPGVPPARAQLVDSLGITDAFLQATLAQDFETAKSFVDLEKVSDAKIAGLCIIFEEGNYQLRNKKPLRALFHRDTTAAFLANVEAGDGSQAAQFGISVQRGEEADPWRVTEINLDTLLADYAERVAGGDVYYTPLIRNPEGGDTLILYFGFDENELTARTKRQLDIVALLLQTDDKKQLTISGHTDALGSEEYNRELSATRARAVRDFLVETGVDPEQIKTVALGKSKPRRPNQTETGEDNPTGRRANRRTEIYLDF